MSSQTSSRMLLWVVTMLAESNVERLLNPGSAGGPRLEV
jgi:hypothetical protein